MLIKAVIVFLTSRDRIVAERLHTVGCGAPCTADRRDIGINSLADADIDAEAAIVGCFTDHMRDLGKTSLREDRKNFLEVLFGDLKDSARLFSEECGERIILWEFDIHAKTTGNRHFSERHGNAAVTTVVVGESKLALHDLLHCIEERLDALCFRIGVLATKLIVHLGETASAEAVLSSAEIDIHELGALAALKIRRKRKRCILNRREARNNERKRSDLTMIDTLRILPCCVHRAGILADRNGNTKRRTEVNANFLDRIEEVCIFAGLAARSHPVCGEANVLDVAAVGRRNVRERLGDCETARSRSVEKRDRCALARCHRLTVESLVAHHRNGAVRRRKLVWTHHLVTGDKARHRTVGNRHEERLVRNRRKVEKTEERVHRLDPCEIKLIVLGLHALDLAHHARRLAEKHLYIHVDRAVVELTVRKHKPAVACRLTDERNRAAFTCAELLEEAACLTAKREHVAFLRFTAPDFHRAHRKLFVVHLAKLELAARSLDELGASVGKAARADVVN